MAKRQIKPRANEPVAGEAAAPAPEAPAVRRFTGPFTLSHAGVAYTRNAAGEIELPAGEEWYLPLIMAGMLTEVTP